METLRLRQLQEPSRVERLLDAYIAHGGELPDDCHQVRDPSGLPPGNSRARLRRGCAVAQLRAFRFDSQGNWTRRTD